MMLFQDEWRRFHDGYRPVSHLLREDGAPNWIRFHSLPQSKRYADNDEERGILLIRQNTLAAEVLSSDACWLVQVLWAPQVDGNENPELEDALADARLWGLAPAFDFTMIDVDKPQMLRAHAVETQWTNARFDNLLTSIADDRAAWTLWMSRATGSIFAPYDGGVDLFLASRTQVAVLRESHSEWLSKETSGL